MIRSLLSLCLLGLIACSKPAPTPVAPRLDATSDPDVKSLFERRHAAVVADPGKSTAHRSLGLAYAANGVWDLAAKCYENALELDPEDRESTYRLAQALREGGDLDGSFALIQELNRKEKDWPPALFELGCLLLERDLLDESADKFQALQVRLPKLPHGPMGLGEVALARGEGKAALKYLTEARKRAPKDRYVGFLLGQAYLEIGQEDRAKPLLEQGAGMDRSKLNAKTAKELNSYRVSRAARLVEAANLLKAGNDAKAVPILEILRTSDPTDTVCLNNLATGYMGQQKFTKALEVIDELLKIKPDQHESHWNRASCYLRLANSMERAGKAKAAQETLAKALESIDECLRISPRYDRGFYLQGVVYNGLGRNSDALDAFRKCVTLGGSSQEVYLDMAMATQKVQGMEAELRVLQEGAALSGPRTKLRFRLCGQLLKAGQGTAAREQQRIMARLAPTDPMTVRADSALKAQGF